MRNYFGNYTASRQSEPITASVLIFDRSISIGYQDESGANHTARWEMNQLSASVVFSDGESLIRNIGTGEELRIAAGFFESYRHRTNARDLHELGFDRFVNGHELVLQLFSFLFWFHVVCFSRFGYG